MIGSLPPPIGGISVSFKALVDILLLRKDVKIEVVDLSCIRRNKGNSLRGFIHLCKDIISKAKKSNVISVYFASTALPTFGLLLVVLSRILHKPLVLRKAAGFDYINLGPLKGRIAHFVVKNTDMYLAETKKLVRLARMRGISNVMWYPTNRQMPTINKLQSLDNRTCRRFVFVGQVREYKGISEIIQAAERCDDTVSVDIYGPLFDDLKQGIFEDCEKVHYCGVLPPNDVIPTLKRYDMLLLPTKAESEGYPGVVFEGYSAGLPIITTRCGGIREIVDESSGIFVEPGDPNTLFDAMNTVVQDDNIYRKLLRGVYEKRGEFDASIWSNRFVRCCEEIAEKM